MSEFYFTFAEGHPKAGKVVKVEASDKWDAFSIAHYAFGQDYEGCYEKKADVPTGLKETTIEFENCDIYLNDWKSFNYKDLRGFEGMCSDFAVTPESLKDIEVLLASYTYADYSGDAFVLFRKDGKLYEVNASHCSCYGLEGQWRPEETSKEALQMRYEKGQLGSGSYGTEFKKEMGIILKYI